MFFFHRYETLGASVETLIWIGVMIAIGGAVWLAAPYHEKLAHDRTLPQESGPSWD